MSTITTEQIKIWGIVQGVGFRPFVAKIGKRLGMHGQILNLGGLVQLTVTDTPSRIDHFLDTLVKEKPAPAEIVHIGRTIVPQVDFKGFSIAESKELTLTDEEAVMIPADLSICSTCMEELRDPKNRRYQHPFISCMACGPRYTIIKKVPYDRDNTTMEDFPMCPECHHEYTTLEDRRYHAQTVSCHDCGPLMQARYQGAGEQIETDDSRENHWLDSAVNILREGGVIGLKTMGGYHLMADPQNPVGVERLRKIKKRDEKPFAVMFPTIGEIRHYCKVNQVEEHLLTSAAKPILLLEQLEGGLKMVESHKSRFIGGFLAAMGGQQMLLDFFGGPLIATSANLSGMPILSRESDMFRMMDKEPLIHAVFYHCRNIEISTEDSVVRVIDGQPQMIRRSRGYAPVPLYVEACQTQMLAVGPQLKNAFALSKGSYVYVSQYFGDLDGKEIQDQYHHNVERMKQLFDVQLAAVVCDLHPLYATTQYALDYAEKWNLPLIQVQHHHAHVASVMAEHNLKGKVIGVSFDGTGYGTDKKIWGGEFLLCQEGNFQRISHLKYMGMIGGDSSMKDGRKSGLSISYNQTQESLWSAEPQGEQRPSSNKEEIQLDFGAILAYGARHNTLGQTADNQIILKALGHGVNTIESSSMGRIFDGVAAILGICDYNHYEGQCAIALEDAADWAMKHPGKNEAADLALAFHRQISQMILNQCEIIRKDTQANQVALTGGVFQNKILMEQTLEALRQNGFEAYYNISVSPNDGGVALGQMFVAQHQLQKMKQQK